jgi:hypothetical protein
MAPIRLQAHQHALRAEEHTLAQPAALLLPVRTQRDQQPAQQQERYRPQRRAEDGQKQVRVPSSPAWR